MEHALHVAKIAAEVVGGALVVIIVLIIVCIVGLMNSKGNPFQ